MTSDGGEDSRELLQERLALFARTLAAIFGALLVIATIGFVVVPEARPPRLEIVQGITALGIGAMAVASPILRRLKPSEVLLFAAETAISVTAGLMIGGASLIAAHLPEQIMMPFSVGVLFVFARVLIVPSSARRTLVLAGATMGLVSIGNLASVGAAAEVLRVPLPAFLGGGIALAIAVVALATTGSSVIYGLRRQVREAQRPGEVAGRAPAERARPARSALRAFRGRRLVRTRRQGLVGRARRPRAADVVGRPRRDRARRDRGRDDRSRAARVGASRRRAPRPRSCARR